VVRASDRYRPIERLTIEARSRRLEAEYLDRRSVALSLDKFRISRLTRPLKLPKSPIPSGWLIPSPRSSMIKPEGAMHTSGSWPTTSSAARQRSVRNQGRAEPGVELSIGGESRSLLRLWIRFGNELPSIRCKFSRGRDMPTEGLTADAKLFAQVRDDGAAPLPMAACARRSLAGVIFGLRPPLRPRARAAASPSAASPQESCW
jgi:hypothetical protein